MDLLEDYKYQVLELLLDGKEDIHTFHSKRMMLELRMTLFVNAAESHTSRPECLMPFPSCFFDPKTKSKNFAHLIRVINSLPKLEDIKEDTFPEGDITWKLLHWVFTNPLTMIPWTPSTYDIYASVQDIKKVTGLPDIPEHNNVLIFKVTNTYPKPAFSEGKNKFGTFYAYHGSKLQNFHSIIHRGLLKTLNVRSSYGPGTYLSNQLKLSQAYSTPQEGWKKSQLKTLFLEAFYNKEFALFGEKHAVQHGQIQCVAIVETVNSPSIKSVTVHKPGLKYFIVDKDELMQLSHLILFL